MTPYQPREDEILWDVEEKHLDEAEFAFEIWEAALDAPNYTLAEIAAGPEQRLLAHVDALIVGGPLVAERLLLPTIADPDACYERVVAATLAFCGAEHQHSTGRVLSILTEADEGEQRRGIMRALDLVVDRSLDAELVRAIDCPRELATAAILEILARRRARVDDRVSTFLQSEEPSIARAAARLVRHCPDPRALHGLDSLAQSNDSALCHAALETALCRQLAGAWESAVYWAFMSANSPFRRDALTWVAILGDAAVHQRLLALVDSPEHRAAALWALGFTGRVAAVDRCVELLDDAEAGPLAAEVICAITGLSAEDDSFWTSPPPTDDEAETLPELLHDDLDLDLVPAPEADLPLPDPTAIARWWAAARGRFDPSVRYVNGQVFTGPALCEALACVPMRRRHALALELQFRTGGAATLDTRGLGVVQQAQLEAVAAVEMPNFQRGLPLGG